MRLAVTSNRRAIVPRHASEQDDPINPRDVVDDKLALADRFGLSVGFHNCNQDDYLAIIAGYAARFGLAFEQADALEWSRRRGQRSGRVARRPNIFLHRALRPEPRAPGAPCPRDPSRDLRGRQAHP